MDINALKLYLIERILATKDPAVLEAVARVLVQEGEEMKGYEPSAGKPLEAGEAAPPYAARTYTREQILRILEEDRAQRGTSAGAELTDDEFALLNERRERHLRGESRSYTWEEAEEILKKDLEQ
ncbi:MAG: hypothetical protein QM724_10625 [Flavobacteriales bacterium]